MEPAVRLLSAPNATQRDNFRSARLDLIAYRFSPAALMISYHRVSARGVPRSRNWPSVKWGGTHDAHHHSIRTHGAGDCHEGSSPPLTASSREPRARLL